VRSPRSRLRSDSESGKARVGMRRARSSCATSRRAACNSHSVRSPTASRKRSSSRSCPTGSFSASAVPRLCRWPSPLPLLRARAWWPACCRSPLQAARRCMSRGRWASAVTPRISCRASRSARRRSSPPTRTRRCSPCRLGTLCV